MNSDLKRAAYIKCCEKLLVFTYNPLTKCRPCWRGVDSPLTEGKSKTFILKLISTGEKKGPDSFTFRWLHIKNWPETRQIFERFQSHRQIFLSWNESFDGVTACSYDLSCLDYGGHKTPDFSGFGVGISHGAITSSKVDRGLKESRLHNCLSVFCVMNWVLPIVSNIKLLNVLDIFFSPIQIKLIVFFLTRHVKITHFSAVITVWHRDFQFKLV